MNTPSLSVDEIEMLLNYWENKIDETKWDDTTREEVIDYLTKSTESYEWWMNTLIKVPDRVVERYQQVIEMLLKSKLITTTIYQEEMEVMNQMSPALMTRQGKVLANWYRSEQALR